MWVSTSNWDITIYARKLSYIFADVTLSNLFLTLCCKGLMQGARRRHCSFLQTSWWKIFWCEIGAFITAVHKSLLTVLIIISKLSVSQSTNEWWSFLGKVALNSGLRKPHYWAPILDTCRHKSSLCFKQCFCVAIGATLASVKQKIPVYSWKGVVFEIQQKQLHSILHVDIGISVSYFCDYWPVCESKNVQSQVVRNAQRYFFFPFPKDFEVRLQISHCHCFCLTRGFPCAETLSDLARLSFKTPKRHKFSASGLHVTVKFIALTGRRAIFRDWTLPPVETCGMS